MYEYRGELRRLVDGDTLHVTIDLGCDTYIRQTIRLYGVNTPEMNTDEGKAAKQFVEDWLEAHASLGEFVIRTVKDRREKYGRYLGVIVGYDGAVLNNDLLVAGHATEYFP